MEIKLIEDKYKPLLNWLSQLKVLEKSVQQELDKTDTEYPTKLYGGVEDIIEQIRKLIRKRVFNVLCNKKIPNININFNELFEDYESDLNLNLKEIIQEVEKLEKDKERLSLESIKNKARELMPHNVNVDVVLQKKWLMLYSYYDSSNYNDRIMAFIKLVRIVLENQNPSIVTSEKHLDNCYYTNYKNGKLKVTFETEEQAKKVFEALCEEEKQELKEITEEQAILICSIKDYKLNQNIRLYNDYYYTDFDKWDNKKYSKKDIKGKNLNDFIKVNGKLYSKWCRKSKLCITQTGNITFGNWWSMDIEPSHINKANVEFSKENFMRELKERKEYIKKLDKGRKEKIYFTYPKIKWVE